MFLRTLTTFLVAIAISFPTQTVFAAPNTPPTANNDTATTSVNTPVLIAVLANDVAASGNPINPASVKVERSPRSGITALQSGQVRYMPRTGFTGTDTLHLHHQRPTGTQVQRSHGDRHRAGGQRGGGRQQRHRFDHGEHDG
jgi:hypothetical protein